MAGQRGMMALMGALAGGSFYLLGLVIEADWLSGRPALALATFAGIFFGGVMITTGPLTLRRAALGSAVLGLALAGLFALASLRFAEAEGLGHSEIALTSLFFLSWLPWPFLIAAGSGAGWRDYPTLFQESWGIVVRVSVALIFTGIVWAVIALSQALLGLVGVRVIGQVLHYAPAPWLITGAVLGLAMAVVNELADILSPGLVLRLLRLLVPVVLVVMLVFLLALPLRGYGSIFGSASSTLVMLAMVVAAVTLVTSALDQEDATCAQGSIVLHGARALAAITILPAGLSCWALWLRIADRGWSPDRLLAASAVGLGLAYGLCYLWAVLHPTSWRARIRQANVTLALGTMGLAVLWLSVLNPEAISTRSQMARFAQGKTSVAGLDLSALQDWGRAGQGALADLRGQAATNPPLAAKLAALDGQSPPAPDAEALRKTLAALLPLQPETAEARTLRDRILAEASTDDLQGWQAACDNRLPQGSPGCVLVVADFLPARPGPEAMLLARSAQGYLVTEGFALAEGSLLRHALTSYDGALPDFEAGAALILQAQKGAPIVPAPLAALQAPGLPALVFAP